MSEEREILVHISAPATKKDDDLYRALTDAYLDFEPLQSHGVVAPRQEAIENRPSLTKRPSTSTEGNSKEAAFIANANISNDSYGSFPSHVNSGNHSSSRENSVPRDSCASVEQDTVDAPSRLNQLHRLQARWREQRALKPNSANRLRPEPRTPISSTAEKTAFIEDTQLAFQAVESQLWDHLSATAEDTSEDEVEPGTGHSSLMASAGVAQVEAHGRLDAIEGPILSEASLSIKSDEVNLRTNSPNLPPASPIALSHDAASIRIGGVPSQALLHFSNLPLEVYPPAPEISVEAPKTWPSQITKFLETIKLNNPQRFKPSKHLRALERDERGHWFVDCRTWPHDVQIDFWSSLYYNIRNGRLGWGITLHREVAHPRYLGPIRLFCWGEIVEHIWLCLWLCSKGKISGSGSTWVDAGDIVVVEVP